MWFFCAGSFILDVDIRRCCALARKASSRTTRKSKTKTKAKARQQITFKLPDPTYTYPKYESPKRDWRHWEELRAKKRRARKLFALIVTISALTFLWRSECPRRIKTMLSGQMVRVMEYFGVEYHPKADVTNSAISALSLFPYWTPPVASAIVEHLMGEGGYKKTRVTMEILRSCQSYAPSWYRVRRRDVNWDEVKEAYAVGARALISEMEKATAPECRIQYYTLVALGDLISKTPAWRQAVQEGMVDEQAFNRALQRVVYQASRHEKREG